MKNNLLFRLMYYSNNYLLSYNLLIGLFLVIELILVCFGKTLIQSSVTGKTFILLTGLSFVAAVLSVAGLFLSYTSLDAFRNGKQIDQSDLKNFRAASMLITISGILSILRIQTSTTDSFSTIINKGLPNLTISGYGIFLLLAGQFIKILCGSIKGYAK